MGVYSENFLISSKGFSDVIDITSKVKNVALNAKIKDGIINIISISPTSSLIVLENVPGIAFDLAKLLDSIVPINKIYQHDNLWHDGNAFSHLRATILGNNLVFPLHNYEIIMDDYSQITFIDFDNKQSDKQVVVTVTY